MLIIKFKQILCTSILLMTAPPLWAKIIPPAVKIQNNTSDTAYLLVKEKNTLEILTLLPVSYHYSDNPIELTMPLELHPLLINLNIPQIQTLPDLLPKTRKNN